MKTKLITILKKNVLLYDSGHTDIQDIKIGNCRIAYRHSEGVSARDIPKGNWKLLGKLKDLTEEQLKPLVDSWESVAKDGTMVYENYKDSIPKKRNAKESSLSALEDEGLHLNGNPIEKCSKKDFEDYCTFCSVHENLCIEQKAFLEAEQNVFSGETLVFVEQ